MAGPCDTPEAGKDRGAVAAGHPATVAAASEVLADGGNAFDAVLAGLCAACVAEPVLASLGGGGFLTARRADGTVTVYDFFAQTPRKRSPADAVDFKPIVADFGTATQEFHIGLGSMAVPGVVAGLFAAHADLGTLPMARLVAPAVALARDGVVVNRFQAFIFDIVEAIYLSTPAARAQYASASRPGALAGEGELLRVPDLADTFEALAREGERLFYEGDIAARLVADCRGGGGLLAQGDLAGYRVERRQPLRVRFRGAEMDTNPPPSSGGLLVAFGLEVLREVDVVADGFGGASHVTALVRAMAATEAARAESAFHRVDPAGAARHLLAPDLLARYRAEVAGHPVAQRGTTHISVVDADGNAAALTVSNGEGSGYIVPGTGIVMNNMLGEEDINPDGFHRWPTDTRLSSMMAPTVMTMADGRLLALGSGGSNRIRTAILQVLVGLAAFDLPLDEVVRRPRLHLEGGRLSVEEPGLAAGAVDAALAAAGLGVDVHRWPDLNLFFGGIHAVCRSPDGTFAAAGDPRRGGVGHVVAK